MKAFVAFFKKEFTESLRSYRLVVLAVVFIFLGVLSPLVAKLMPELFSGVDLGGGIVITAPQPTAMDSWTQFFGNVGQMGMLALIITFSGIMAGELSRGTLINLLTKGMPRHTVIISKFLFASALWTVSYLLCLGICFAYTEYFWPQAALSNAMPAFLSLWIFGELLITLLIFGGTLFGNLYGSLLLCLGPILALTLLNIIPAMQAYNPISLAGNTINLLDGSKEIADFLPAMLITGGMTVVLLVMSIVVFNKKQV